MNDPKRAKETFNRFIKGVIKHYGRYDMAGLYVQERRHDGTYHFHVCFLFFSPNNLPYAPTRMYRDMKTDIFKRWKKLNAEIDKCSRGGNDLTEHQFNLDSAGYFCRAVIVADATVRKETNWFGIFNWHLVSNRSIAATRAEKKAVFDRFFVCEDKIDRLMREYNNQKLLKKADTEGDIPF